MKSFAKNKHFVRFIKFFIGSIFGITFIFRFGAKRYEGVFESFSEVFEHFPTILLLSFVFSILITYLYRNGSELDVNNKRK